MFQRRDSRTQSFGGTSSPWWLMLQSYTFGHLLPFLAPWLNHSLLMPLKPWLVVCSWRGCSCIPSWLSFRLQLRRSLRMDSSRAVYIWWAESSACASLTLESRWAAGSAGKSRHHDRWRGAAGTSGRMKSGIRNAALLQSCLSALQNPNSTSNWAVFPGYTSRSRTAWRMPLLTKLHEGDFRVSVYSPFHHLASVQRLGLLHWCQLTRTGRLVSLWIRLQAHLTSSCP